MAHEGSRQERQARDRGMTRSKAEKVRPPTVPVPQVDIVPGRLTEAEWMALSVLEEGEEVVGDILADLLARVMDSAFKVYLTQQSGTGGHAADHRVALPGPGRGRNCSCRGPYVGRGRRTFRLHDGRLGSGIRARAARAHLRDLPRRSKPSPQLPPATHLSASLPFATSHYSTSHHHPGAFPQDRGSVDQIPSGRSWMDTGSQEPMEPWDRCPPEQRVVPGPSSTLELLKETGPRGPLEELELDGQARGHLSSVGCLNVSSQLSMEMAVAGSPHLSLEPTPVASPKGSVEKAQPFSSPFSLEDLYYCTPQAQAAGDRMELKKEEVPLISSSGSVSGTSAGGLSTLSSSSGFQPQQPWRPDARTSSLRGRIGPRAEMERLDPARLPRRWVRPLAEVLVPNSEMRPQKAYRGRLQSRKTEAPAGPQAPGPDVRVSPSVFYPLPPGVPFQALAPGRRLQFPTLSSGLPSPGFGSKLPFPSSRLRFPITHSVLPDVAHSPSPKLWPGAKWPSGWEGEAELLGELWAGRTRIPPQGLDPGYRESQDPHKWPHPAPQVLEATSQVMWKPMLLPEALKLAPGVSMWNPTTQELLSSAEPQQEDKKGSTSPPIHTGAPEPQVTVAQIVNNSTPKMWSLPFNHLLHYEP
ncbi:uncharacterized protein C2orf81 homolog isoform X1 [Phacochoerus africanus]|uniref:uncharacterized protein C2orf81 homolog isoform X1 n=1 Tax=Phacochoerus africanus TaxID=41426 RepID=UPI001FD9DA57|nr:uncharacterized protein C2orf81 homolog isoform X1 [Phacochoerus africanus]